MADDEQLLAEFTDGFTKTIEPITEELVLGTSWLFYTPGEQDVWHTVTKVEPLHNRRDGVRFRVTLEHNLRSR